MQQNFNHFYKNTEYQTSKRKLLIFVFMSFTTIIFLLLGHISHHGYKGWPILYGKNFYHELFAYVVSAAFSLKNLFIWYVHVLDPSLSRYQESFLLFQPNCLSSMLSKNGLHILPWTGITFIDKSNSFFLKFYNTFLSNLSACGKPHSW